MVIILLIYNNWPPICDDISPNTGADEAASTVSSVDVISIMDRYPTTLTEFWINSEPLSVRVLRMLATSPSSTELILPLACLSKNATGWCSMLA